MSYQVIARKFRPQSFDQVVGQNHITQTLGNALKNGRLPHALLFTGPRGTGKTSSARILAKSLRCANAVNFNPCNTCESCLEIAQGRSVDVIEIDGASNNGVDAIRELRDTVGYMPSSGKYKVYIIDEVHMLSTSAFNALLKTLEEPPDHVVFIMATTEVHKIPATILSRCQRFDFRRISTRQITQHLGFICAEEKVSATDEALWLIARQADGSMRDSQSLLDQVITFANGALSRENVTQILGLTDRSLLLETTTALLARDTTATLRLLEKIYTAGYEAHLFAQDLLETLRHLLLVKISSAENSEVTTSIVELPDSELAALKTLGQNLSEEEIHLLFDMCLKGAGEIPRAQDPRIVLEMALLRMSQAPRIVDLHSIISGDKSTVRQTTAQAPGAVTVASLIAKPSSKSTPANAAKAPTSVSAPTTAASLLGADTTLAPQEKWLTFVQHMRSAEALFAAKVENLLFVSDDNKMITVSVPAKMQFLKDQMADASVRKKLQSFLDQFWGPGYAIEIKGTAEGSVGLSAQALEEKKRVEKEDELRKKIEAHPVIKSATKAFNGQIKEIKDSKNNA